ncbi:MAG: hypothetical protein RRY34_03960, partial [Victivallaceae bacterium]
FSWYLILGVVVLSGCIGFEPGFSELDLNNAKNLVYENVILSAEDKETITNGYHYFIQDNFIYIKVAFSKSKLSDLNGEFVVSFYSSPAEKAVVLESMEIRDNYKRKFNNELDILFSCLRLTEPKKEYFAALHTKIIKRDKYYDIEFIDKKGENEIIVCSVYGIKKVDNNVFVFHNLKINY